MISIIVPIYNCEDFLQYGIKSIIRQSYPNWELVLINDGSTDQSGTICDKCVEQESRILVIHQTNGGPSIARNAGLKAIRGEHCIFMDSDDYFEVNAFQTMADIVMDKDPQVIFYPNITDKIINGRYVPINNNIMYNNSIRSNQEFKEFYEELKTHRYLYPVWNKLYKKDFIIKSNASFPPKISICEDMEFNLFLYPKLEQAELIDTPLYHYVSRNYNSITTTFNRSRFNESKIVYLNCLEIYKKWNCSQINFIRNEFVTNISVCINGLFNKDCPYVFKDKRNYVLEIIGDNVVQTTLNAFTPLGIRNHIISLLIIAKKVYLLLIAGSLTRKLRCWRYGSWKTL